MAKVLSFRSIGAKAELDYDIGQLIMKGGFGSVSKAKRKSDGECVAIKTIETGSKSMSWSYSYGHKKVPTEIAVMALCYEIEGVVKLIEYYKKGKCYTIVMEKPKNCVDLFDYISNRGGPLSEKESWNVFRFILNTSKKMWEAGFIHGDIKEENIIIDTSTHELTLVDFGGAIFLGEQTYDYSFGTTENHPPEYITHGNYTPAGMLAWTVGILLHGSVFGYLPFRSKKEIVNKKIAENDQISKPCRMVLAGCLQKDPLERVSLRSLLASDWLQNGPIDDRQTGSFRI